MILLDTNALIQLSQKGPIRPAAQAAITDAFERAMLCVSVTSAWEVGLLATRTGKTRVVFVGDARRWFADVVASAKLRVIPLDAEMALEAAYLPGTLHRDPSDRWIIAVARRIDATIVTSDRRILAYAAEGHVKALRL